MKSKVSFDVTPPSEAGASHSPQVAIDIRSGGSKGRNPSPAFSNCPICRAEVNPGEVLPENAHIPVPVSIGEKKPSRWTRRHCLLLTMYSVLTILMGFGLVGAFLLMGAKGILYAVPVFIVVIIAAYCLTQQKREKKRIRNTIILRNCKSCRQRLHLKASVNNKIVE